MKLIRCDWTDCPATRPEPSRGERLHPWACITHGYADGEKHFCPEHAPEVIRKIQEAIDRVRPVSEALPLKPSE